MMAKTCVAATIAVILPCGFASAQSNDVGVGAGVGLGHAGESAPVMQLRSEQVPGVTFQFGSASDSRRQINPLDATGVGGFAGLVVNNGPLSGTEVGLNLQGTSGDPDAGGAMVFELGADYSIPVAESWQFSARLSSSFAADNTSGPTGTGGYGGSRSGLDTSAGDGRFKDVGLGVGLDYNFAESWQLETNLGYTRLIGDANRRSLADEDAGSHQFFGGVVVNYRF